MKRQIDDLKKKYPLIPIHALPLHGKAKKRTPANQLQQDVIDYIKSRGGYAFRVNVQGNYSEKLRRFIYSGSERGTSDVIGCFDGLLLAIEVKINKDKQSPAQIKFQANIKAAGGRYLIAKDFETFKNDLQTIINNIQL